MSLQFFRIAKNPHKGSMLAEFAVVALALYLLIAFALTIGHFLFCSMITQQAVETAARELSRTPLPPTARFEEDVLDNSDSEFSRTIYSEDYLAIDITAWVDSSEGLTLVEYLDTQVGLPLVNRILLPTMIFQIVEDKKLLRYPGALVRSASAPSGYTVEVPIVVARDEAGVETIKWARVLEEIDTEELASDDTPPSPDPFSIISKERGLVALRLNFPFQSSFISQGRRIDISKNNQEESAAIQAVIADDDKVQQMNSLQAGDQLVDPRQEAGPYAGSKGLGRQLALGQTLRPFRRILSLEAFFRREVFE
jgi:hypothetical protein